MQSCKIYSQKSSVIVPDKRIKIIEILWHIFSEFTTFSFKILNDNLCT